LFELFRPGNGHGVAFVAVAECRADFAPAVPCGALDAPGRARDEIIPAHVAAARVDEAGVDLGVQPVLAGVRADVGEARIIVIEAYPAMQPVESVPPCERHLAEHIEVQRMQAEAVNA